MIKKLVFSTLLFALVLGGFGFIGVDSASAQTASFPDGCASGLGYSSTDGKPCNGKSVATQRYMPGCESALGYSATTGIPCSGSSEAIQWLAGCTSTIGYSAITGEPCNGTNVATPIVVVIPPTNPGLPTTGGGGDALLNIALLAVLAVTSAVGSTYLVRNYKSK